MTEFSRRDFLKISVAATAAFGLKVLNAPLVLRALGREVEPYFVETASGNFIQLLGVHGTEIAGIGTGNDSLPKEVFSDSNIDVVFFEGGSIPGGPYSGADIDKYFVKFENDKSYTGWEKDLFPVLTKKGIPIIIGDLQNRSLLKGAESILLNMTEVVASVGGVAMAVSDRPDGLLTRREFLKKAGGTFLALWGFSGLGGEVLGNSLRDLTKLPWVQDLRKVAAFTEFSHPEDIIVNFRNALIAEKLLYYSEVKGRELGRKPNVAIVMGLGHELMSEYLRAGREFCRNYLNLYPDGFLRHFFGEENLEKHFSGIFEMTPTMGLLKLKVFRDPELEKRFGLVPTEKNNFSTLK